MKEAIYENEKVALLPFSRHDMTAEYRSWFYDIEVTRYNSHGLFPYTKGQMERLLKVIEEGASDEIIFAIYAKTDEPAGGLRHVGNCSILRINYINRSAELAWVIGDKTVWGKGIATDAGKFLLYHCFNRLNMHRVWTGVVKENVGMRRVCKKLGMQEEGEYRDAVFLHGRYHNIIPYCILEDNYSLHLAAGDRYAT